MCFRKKILGLILFCLGAGMLFVLVIPGWGFILALLLVIVGFFNLFL